MDHVDNPSSGDAIEVRVGSMAAGTWIQLDDPGTAIVEGDWQSWKPEEGTWADIENVNLSAFLAANALDFDSGFQIRWRQHGVNNADYPGYPEGLSLDDVRLHLGGGDAEIAGRVWKDWNQTSSYDSGEGMPCVLVTLYPDLDGDQVLDLNESQSPLAAARSAADGAYRFPYLAPGDYLLDLDSATLRHGLSVVGIDPRPRTLLAAETATVDFEVAGSAILPFTEGFEGAREPAYWGDATCLEGVPDFRYTETEAGRLDFFRDDALGRFQFNGTRSATMDAVRSVATVNELTLTLDLSAYTAAVQQVTLDFAWAHHVLNSTYWAGENGGLFVRGSSSDPWLPVLNTTSPNDQWEAEATGASPLSAGVFRQESGIDLSQILLDGGQEFSSTFELQFLLDGIWYAEPELPERRGGITIDDVVLNGPPPGVIVGDRIWNDLDGDGEQDPGEPGLANVGLSLSDSGGVIATTSTDASGDSQFYLASTGDYTILVDPPEGGTVSWDPDGPYSAEDPEQGDNKADLFDLRTGREHPESGLRLLLHRHHWWHGLGRPRRRPGARIRTKRESPVWPCSCSRGRRSSRRRLPTPMATTSSPASARPPGRSPCPHRPTGCRRPCRPTTSTVWAAPTSRRSACSTGRTAPTSTSAIAIRRRSAARSGTTTTRTAPSRARIRSPA